MSEVCVICEGLVDVKSDKAIFAKCSNCGIVPRKKYLIAELVQAGADKDAAALLQFCNKEVLEEILTRKRYGTPFLAKLIAYEYFLLQGRYRDAEDLARTIGERKLVNMFKKYHAKLFGKRVCLNDCMINMFVERSSEILSEDVLNRCVEILRDISKKRTIYKSDLAALMYFFSPLPEEDVARMFGVTENSVRNAVRRMSHKLATELFNAITDGYVDDKDKFVGLGMINSLASNGTVTKRDVKRLVLMYREVPIERIKMFFRKL
jgi:ribosomal protein L22